MEAKPTITTFTMEEVLSSFTRRIMSTMRASVASLSRKSSRKSHLPTGKCT